VAFWNESRGEGTAGRKFREVGGGGKSHVTGGNAKGNAILQCISGETKKKKRDTASGIAKIFA